MSFVWEMQNLAAGKLHTSHLDIANTAPDLNKNY